MTGVRAKTRYIDLVSCNVEDARRALELELVSVKAEDANGNPIPVVAELDEQGLTLKFGRDVPTGLIEVTYMTDEKRKPMSEPTRGLWRCEECRYVDREKKMPTDRKKFYARVEKSGAPRCPMCSSEAFMPVGF